MMLALKNYKYGYYDKEPNICVPHMIVGVEKIAIENFMYRNEREMAPIYVMGEYDPRYTYTGTHIGGKFTVRCEDIVSGNFVDDYMCGNETFDIEVKITKNGVLNLMTIRKAIVIESSSDYLRDYYKIKFKAKDLTYLEL